MSLSYSQLVLNRSFDPPPLDASADPRLMQGWKRTSESGPRREEAARPGPMEPISLCLILGKPDGFVNTIVTTVIYVR